MVGWHKRLKMHSSQFGAITNFSIDLQNQGGVMPESNRIELKRELMILCGSMGAEVEM